MKSITEIDKNLAVETSIERDGLRFYDVRQEPFRIYGVFWENGMFRRMPEVIAKTVNEGVYGLHSNGAGGRVCFVTDSPYVAIKTEYIPGKMPHFAISGSAGFDMYARVDGEDRYAGTFMPPLMWKTVMKVSLILSVNARDILQSICPYTALLVSCILV